MNTSMAPCMSPCIGLVSIHKIARAHGLTRATILGTLCKEKNENFFLSFFQQYFCHRKGVSQQNLVIELWLWCMLDDMMKTYNQSTRLKNLQKKKTHLGGKNIIFNRLNMTNLQLIFLRWRSIVKTCLKLQSVTGLWPTYLEWLL